MLYLIDRRLNGRNKSAVNRERFLRRYKAQIRKAVGDMIGERSITDMERGGNVNIPRKDIHEPSFHHGPGGDRELVHPGNREFITGDTFPRPQSGGGGDGGNDPSEGEGEDSFSFALSREEFLAIFFEDLELPNLLRTVLGDTQQKKWTRAGYVPNGTPCNLSVVRTLKSALSRRIALTGEARRELEEAQAERAAALAAGMPVAEIERLDAGIVEIEARLAVVPFLDDLDLRYRNRVSTPAPMARAVMFCLMDVSASMDEAKKDLAKRFFTLLYLFLTRKYERVDLVFIRHTDDADEVDEETFFHDRKSGGTVVYSALALMREIIDARYPASEWNIYASQASDGDAFGSDAGRSARFLQEHLLPLTRYFAYIEVPDHAAARMSSLWAEYAPAKSARENFAMTRVSRPEEIYPVFRELFRKENA